MTLFQSAFGFDLQLDPLWCAWFSGWIDGEGCFMSRVKKVGLGISPILRVGVRNDDADLLVYVKNTIKCGLIIHSDKQYERDKGKNARDAIEWRCVDFGACRHILIPLFDEYPLHSKKKHDYVIWRELVIDLYEGKHLNGGHDRCFDLCRQLSNAKKYKYFESEIVDDASQE